MQAPRSEVETARKAGVKEGAARSIAQMFALVVGLGLIGAGVLGFFFGGSEFSTGTNIQGEEFLGFEVNGWHNVVHIATGAFLVLMSPKAKSAVTGALIFAAAYGFVTVWGFIDGNTVVNLIPVNTADNILHALLTGGALLAAFLSGGFMAWSRKDEEELRRGDGRRTGRFDRTAPEHDRPREQVGPRS